MSKGNSAVFRPVMLLTLVLASVAVSFAVTYTMFGPSTETEQRVLSIFCFQGYAEPEWIAAFEQEHNCRIRLTYTSTIEEMLDQVTAAPQAYHLISIDSGRVAVYQGRDLIQPIEANKLTHYAGIDPYFREHPYSFSPDGKDLLHVPIMWGTQTVVINTEKVPERIVNHYLRENGASVSMDILLDPALRGHIAFFDEAPNVFAAAAMDIGVKNPHQLQPDEWAPVEQRIRLFAEAAHHFTTGIESEFSALSGGEVWVLMGGNDALLARRLESTGIGDRFLQRPLHEGTHCWIDGWAMTKATTGESYDLALAWIDRMISERGQKELVATTGFGPITNLGDAKDGVTAKRVPWYSQPLAEFPGHLVIMAPEEDLNRRISTWKRIKEEVAVD